MYSKIVDNNNLVRDESTKAILNTNLTDYNNYLKLKKSKEIEAKRMQKLESDVSNLKTDLDEIKDLLRSLANKP
tara:strand:+ start:494 stop:715 length:222 start_codon:yes stop_codon:yes gene_type:complete